ncbi:uncharacterized protein BYT42DRAFT_544446 [Radiomyces spectabilis]|uniref:uncharacterized protein n=1 Tax=Radiomyces spectabilis TaxID=64574 RepID=UPI00221F48B9|nr:uncharacterized protein BYT42DRAFT_544446 [Radiomyces spectabilis]KAI8384561.1 hypothetical protein BYT42DRAFT_544446 [Radiomyces spectabilis]
MSAETASKEVTKSKILKQVEFYFSDSNLPYDKYLWSLFKKTPEGWIDIKTIASFKKMKKISTDQDLIVEALKESPEMLEVSEDNEKVRRKTQLEKQDHISRSIYAKGFPLMDNDADKLMDLQDKIDEFFSQYGKVLCVRMKKEHVKPFNFKGSAYIEFSSPEESDKVAKMDLEFEGNKLEVKTRKDYIAVKSEEYNNKPRTDRVFKKKAFNAWYQDVSANSTQKRARENDQGLAEPNEKKPKSEETPAAENKESTD